jgi:xanthine dehydrogenase small subunit
MRNRIRFLRNGNVVELADFAPDALLLDHLRLNERRTGTKEGCGEGDCGACTVAIGRAKGNAVEYRPVNACITLLGSIDGAEVVTVEDIGGAEGGLHPVQAALVEKHGSQCGFCTPGFVMALFALYQNSEGPVARGTVNDWLAGNLCRCTGYRPIVEAGLAACAGQRSDRHRRQAADTAAMLGFLADAEDVFVGTEERFFAAPADLGRLCELYERHPTAAIVSGATDVGLWITKQLRELPKIIHVGRVKGFDRIEETERELLIGAGVTYQAAEPHLTRLDPDLGELVRRIGSRQVRATGTVGGNVANGSPIGDMPPALIALGAKLELRRGTRTRVIALEDFFIDYGKQDRAAGELVTGLMMPKLKPGETFRCYKVAKRFDQDISSVMAAIRFSLGAERTIDDIRIAYGGMAATPKRARTAEAVLKGTRLDAPARWRDAFAALREDYQPISDHRASARYRIETAQALLGRALTEAAGTSTSRTRLLGRREAALDAAR